MLHTYSSVVTDLSSGTSRKTRSTLTRAIQPDKKKFSHVQSRNINKHVIMDYILHSSPPEHSKVKTIDVSEYETA